MKKFVVNCALVISLFASVAIAEDPCEVAWSRQLGTNEMDASSSVAVDGSHNAFNGLTNTLNPTFLGGLGLFFGLRLPPRYPILSYRMQGGPRSSWDAMPPS